MSCKNPPKRTSEGIEQQSLTIPETTFSTESGAWLSGGRITWSRENLEYRQFQRHDSLGAGKLAKRAWRQDSLPRKLRGRTTWKPDNLEVEVPGGRRA